MKHYLLFTFGDFKQAAIRENIVQTVCSMSCSELVKFKETETYIYFNFETTTPHVELANFFAATIGQVAESHILTEFTDKTSVSMNSIDLREFMSLKTSQSDKDMLKNILNDITNPCGEQSYAESIFKKLFNLTDEEISEYDEYDDMDDEEEDDFYKRTKLKHNLDLDDILEKIKREGKSSLTDEEIKFLKTV